MESQAVELTDRRARLPDWGLDEVEPDLAGIARYWIESGAYSQVTFVGVVVWSGFGTL